MKNSFLLILSFSALQLWKTHSACAPAKLTQPAITFFNGTVLKPRNTLNNDNGTEDTADFLQRNTLPKLALSADSFYSPADPIIKTPRISLLDLILFRNNFSWKTYNTSRNLYFPKPEDTADETANTAVLPAVHKYASLPSQPAIPHGNTTKASDMDIDTKGKTASEITQGNPGQLEFPSKENQTIVIRLTARLPVLNSGAHALCSEFCAVSRKGAE